MKKSLLLFAFVFITINVVAQTGYNYYQFGMGIGGDLSYERAYTNIPKEDNHVAFDLNLNVNYSPYVSVSGELQLGTLSGGGLTPKEDSLGRKYINHYRAFLFHADFELGQFINYSNNHFLSIIKNFYIGAGVGIIFNNVQAQRTNIIVGNGPPTSVFPGANTSINIVVPVRFGYEFKIFNQYDEPSCAIDIGYIRNLVYGEGLDGYDQPPGKSTFVPTNQYAQFIVGFKYYFGSLHSYKKLIRAFDKN